MEEARTWTDSVMADGFAGLDDDLYFPMTPATQQSNVIDPALQVPATGGVERSCREKGVSKRSKIFDPKEDEIICSAWLNVSKDPIRGANQTRVSYWGRFHAYFEKHKETIGFRTENSIMHRWLTIQREVNRYCSFYDSITRRNQSGATIQDMISSALEMYKRLDEEHRSFTLMHCYDKLKKEDKWAARRRELAEQEKQNAKKKAKTRKDATPGTIVSTNDEEAPAENATPNSEERKRPLGQKKAKEALKRGGGEACMKALDKMWAKKEAFDMEKERRREERFLMSFELEKKRVTAEEKKAEADLIKEEKEIMLMDMSSLNPDQKEYYETMRKKILARRMSN